MSSMCKTSPSSNCNSIPQVTLDLECFLSNIVGPFALTYFSDTGEVCKLGNLTRTGNELISADEALGNHAAYHSSTPVASVVSSLNDSGFNTPSPISSASSITDNELNFEPLKNLYPDFIQSGENSPCDTGDLLLDPELKSINTPPNRDSNHSSTNVSSLPRDSRLRVANIINSRLTTKALLKYWNLEHLDYLHEEVDSFTSLLWGIEASVLKPLAAELVNCSYPARRKLHPYSTGVRLKEWPSFVDYKDPAHLTVPQRLTLTVWLCLAPTHKAHVILRVMKKYAPRFGRVDKEIILKDIIQLRSLLWGQPLSEKDAHEFY